MHELAMRIRKLRLASGAIELNMPKVKVRLDDQGKVASAAPEIQTESHQIIEEFMLAANMAVAERLRDAKLPFLRRVHDEPRPRKIEALDKFVRQLRLNPRNLRDRFGLKDLLADVAGTPLEPVINLAVLKSMAKAVYSIEAVGHYALASDCYCHFTSPIRRFPDLLVHRALDLLNGNGRSKKPSRAALAQLADECSELEQRAEKSERELIKLKLLRYFGERLGERFEAVITGLESYGIFVQCTTIPGEGWIPRERLKYDFRLDRSRTKLANRHTGTSFQIGDLVEVEVARTDLGRREIDFDYLRHIRPLTASAGRQRVKQKEAKSPRRRSTKKKRQKRGRG
jgi:ribonuclease R